MAEWKDFLQGLDWKAILVAGLIGTFIGALLKEAAKDAYSRLSKKYFAAAVPPETPEKAISSITLTQVLEDLSSAAPLQQRRTAQSYLGIRVRWDLQFQAGSEAFGTYVLTFAPPAGGPFAVVQCDVPAKNHPEMSVLHRGRSVRVTGEIKSIERAMTITLSQAQVEILA